MEIDCGSEIVEDLKSVDIAGQMLDRLQKILHRGSRIALVIKDISEDVELIRYGRSVRVDSKNKEKY